MTSKKGQAKIEYLVLNGWSILISTIVGLVVLAIVISAVYYFRHVTQ